MGIQAINTRDALIKCKIGQIFIEKKIKKNQ